MNNRIGNLVLASTFALLSACVGGEGDITGIRSGAPVAHVLDDRAPGQVELCKIGPVGTFARFAIEADGGNLPAGQVVTVQAQAPDAFDGNLCTVVWRATEPAQVPDVISTVTITEVEMSPGTTLEKVFFGNGVGSEFIYPPIEGITFEVSFNEGALVKFFNIYTPPTDGGGEGCTPGYWKQSQHFDSWTTPYAPATLFSSVFADAFPGKSLLDVVSTGGGGLNALGRHTVAALLNAASGEVDNGMTSAGVVSAFNAAFASGDYEAQKNIFEASNEMGCPLN